MGKIPIRIQDLNIANDAKEIFGVSYETDDPEYSMRPKNDYWMTVWWYILRLLQKKPLSYTQLSRTLNLHGETLAKYLKLLLKYKFVQKNKNYSITDKGRQLLRLFETKC